MKKPFILQMDKVSIGDVSEVGGKNASLGEMLQYLKPKGVHIPDGFVITATAYRHFVHESKVPSKEGTGMLVDFIRKTLAGLNTKNLSDLHKKGEEVRAAIRTAQLPADLEEDIRAAYVRMEKQYGPSVDVAVRSSATAEDLPGASFAGQQETYLNIRGQEDLIIATKKCFASLFTDRAISYRHDKGFDHMQIALSIGVQKMVRSDKGVSGIMFTLDTESGFKDVVNINGTWGLGEMIVQGEIIPDEFLVYKPFLDNKKLDPIISKKKGKKEKMMIYAMGATPTKIIPTPQEKRHAFVLSDAEILQLARWGKLIEEHYTHVHKKWTPMDTEWAKDGRDGTLYIVQARPETVQASRDFTKLVEYRRTQEGEEIVRGASVGSAVASGTAHVILDTKNIGAFKQGEVLVTGMTDPDWEPIMKMAAAIVTDKGGRTSHAAIVSRELGIPCIVGTELATKKIKTGDVVTVDTTGSEGIVLRGNLKFEKTQHDMKKMKVPAVHLMVNIATPDTAFEKSFLPATGVGLAREEFIIASDIGIHPSLLVDFEKIKSKNFEFRISNFETNEKAQRYVQKAIKEVEERTQGYADKKQFYVDQLAYGIAKIGAAFYPRPVIVRYSDFKTNEYRQLVGGELFEPKEENPMIGWRGASRYYHPAFAEAFKLELAAMKKVRVSMGLSNVHGMVPFCRTPEEGKKVKKLIEAAGLTKTGMKTYVMCEIPANVLRADEFLDVFDGMSIGSNDLTQLTVGIDRDGNERIRSIANETDESVKVLISAIIKKARAQKKYIGICGQAPSDIPSFAEFLVKEGIESISLNPDSLLKTVLLLTGKKAQVKKATKTK